MPAPRFSTTTHLTGRSSELHVAAEMTYLGIPVFTTENQFTRADLLVEVAEQVKRVQVKTMMWRETRRYFFARPETSGKRGYGETIDFFVFFCREENLYFIVPFEVAIQVYEVSWTPTRLREKKGGAPRKVDMDKYINAWDLLLPSELSDWRQQRLADCNKRL